jgi:anaerobic magnesium-protoporphyrin IX monomethyl ester cyclase
MKVLLVQSLWRKQEHPVFPLGLACLAASLRGRHEVRCYDESAPASGQSLRLEDLLGWGPDVVGIGMRNCDGLGYQDTALGDVEGALSPLQHVRDLADSVRASLPGAVIVAGGAAFTVFARRVMEVAQAIDIGVVGEGEETLARLLDSLDKPGEVPGVIYRKNGLLEQTGPAALPDLRSLPAPDRVVMDVRPYVALGDPWAVGVQSKRGCGLSCAYCVYPLLNGPGIRMRSPSVVVDELEDLVGNFGLKTFQFADSVFNRPREHAAAICREMLARGLKADWSAWFDIPSLDEDLMRLAMAAGCRMFELSPDSCSDSLLRALGKNISRADILGVCRMASRIPGARISLNFIVGAPGETVATLAGMLLFALRLKIFRRRSVTVNIFNPIRIMPGTPIHRRAVAEGFIDADAQLLPVDPCASEGLYYLSERSPVAFAYRAFLRLGALRRKLFRSS